MGFITPSPVPFDVAEWKQKTELEKIKPLAQDWAINGFGTPYAIYLMYIVKLVLFSVGAFLLIGATLPGSGGLGNIGEWWLEPIVFQKVLVWMVVYEMIGLGSSSMPLSYRFNPPIGCILYWARPGTLRLPPWRGKNPLAGTSNTRNIVDVLLYLGVLGTGIWLLLSAGVPFDAAGTPVAGAEYGRLDPTGIAVLLGLWALLGLRDRVSFLCGRPEVYGLMLVVSLFPMENFIIGSQIALVCIWFGAATSKLNHHFGSVVAVMIANTPWQRSKWFKRKLWRNHPEDLRASNVANMAAHTGTLIEFTFPLLLLFTQGGLIGQIAAIAMIIFHIHITSTFPLAVPLEWNLFMIFGVLFLFTGANAMVPFDTLTAMPLLAILLVCGVGIMLLGNARPDLISFLPSMRYYAGNWATSIWLFRKDTEAEEKLDTRLKKTAPVVFKQLEKMYDADTAELFLYKARAFRSMHPHGRALNGLLPHAAVGGDVEAYHVREGEFLCGALIGWNFGDGHFHHKQMLDAVQEQCQFGEGEVRVIALESQPIQTQRQRYQIFDAVTGLVEEGSVGVRDMIERQPWLDLNYEFPIDVDGGVGAPPVPAASPETAPAPA
jgi:hypothetical protein